MSKFHYAYYDAYYALSTLASMIQSGRHFRARRRASASAARALPPAASRTGGLPPAAPAAAAAPIRPTSSSAQVVHLLCPFAPLCGPQDPRKERGVYQIYTEDTAKRPPPHPDRDTYTTPWRPPPPPSPSPSWPGTPGTRSPPSACRSSAPTRSG